MACTDLFLVIKRRNNTPVFRKGPGRGVCVRVVLFPSCLPLPSPACLAQGPSELAASLLLPASLWLYIPAKEASHAICGKLQHLHPGWAPPSCTGDLQRPWGFYSILRMSKHFGGAAAARYRRALKNTQQVSSICL